MSRFGWLLGILVVSCAAGLGVTGYVFYKYRLRVCMHCPVYQTVLHTLQIHDKNCLLYFLPQSYMDSEIMAIMSQYMPLDSQNNEHQPLRQHASEA
jgi:hypothetical protein